MKNVFFVKPQQAELARQLEQRLIGLSQESGIIFVGVQVQDGKEILGPTYAIFIGCNRSMEVSAIEELTKLVLKDGIFDDVRDTCSIYVFRGIDRSSNIN